MGCQSSTHVESSADLAIQQSADGTLLDSNPCKNGADSGTDKSGTSPVSKRTALITGGSSGIGKALALRLANAGLDVLIVARRETALKEVASLCAGIRTCVADVASEEGRDAIKAALGDAPLHLLVHNAGVNCMDPLTKVELSKFRATIAVNTEAPVFLTQHLLPNLKLAEEARILLVSSGAGDMHVPNMGPYCVTKAALKMVWTVLKDELADVAHVGYCKPGLVLSEMTGAMIEKEDFALKDFIGGRMESGDIHTSEEVAEWMEALLDCARCESREFQEREHNIDIIEHQLGVKVRVTMEGKLLDQASAESATA